MAPEVYISVDVETDGPIPGQYSMLSLGACVAGIDHGGGYERRGPDSFRGFYTTLKPISDEFLPKALEVTGLDRVALVESGPPPASAMAQFQVWVSSVANGNTYRPVFCAYPLSFDWTWSHWYFMRFLGADPFGFSSALDMKTMYAAKARVPISRASKRQWKPKSLRDTGGLKHTHNALDDAREQAALLSNLMEWGGRGG